MPTPKLEVFAGIACYPRHPLADMHGLIRVVVKAETRRRALSVLRAVGVKRVAFFAPTGSAIERGIAQYRSVFVSSLTEMYLNASRYQMFDSVLPIAALKRGTK